LERDILIGPPSRDERGRKGKKPGRKVIGARLLKSPRSPVSGRGGGKDKQVRKKASRSGWGRETSTNFWRIKIHSYGVPQTGEVWR